MPSTGPTLQRLLGAVLALVVLASAWLLWKLNADGPRIAALLPAASEVGATSPHSPVAPLEGDVAPNGSERPVRSAEPVAVRADETAAPVDAGPSDTALTGIVRGAGAPLEGIELFLFREALERNETLEPLARTVTGATGRFRVEGVEPHTRLWAVCQAPSFLPWRGSLYPGREEEIELEPAATLRGRVLSAASLEPLAGVQVALRRDHWTAAGIAPLLSSITDAEGGWELAWAEPGIEEILVVRPGRLPARHEFQVERAGGEGYDILLDDELALELEVFDLASGAPLADTELVVDATVRTDAAGRIGWPLPPSGIPDSGLQVSLGLPGGCVTQLRLEPEQAQGLVRVPVTRGGVVRGRVLDADGNAVEGARVRLGGGGRLPTTLTLPQGCWLQAQRTPARTGPDGRFELRGLPPREGTVELRAQHAGHPPGRSTPFALATLDAEAEVEIRLERGGTVQGRVTVNGEPAAASIYWESARGGGSTGANARGEYRCTGVPAGEVRIGARLDEDEDYEGPEDRALWIDDGATVECDLALAAHRAPIEGRVLDSDGAVVADAEVYASIDDEDSGFQFEGWSRTADDGTFSLVVPDEPGAQYWVQVSSGPREAELAGVAPGTRGLEFVLPTLGDLELRVVDALSREPVRGFKLYWRVSGPAGDEDEDAGWQRLVQGGSRLAPGPSGTFLARLPRGRVDLAVTARSRGYRPALLREIECAAEARGTPLTIELEPGVELALDFHAADGAEALLASLQRTRFALASEEQLAERSLGGELFREEVREAQSVRLDEQGHAHLRALAPGTYRFVNLPRHFQLTPSTFELPSVESFRLAVEVQPGEGPPPEPRGRRRDER